MEPDDHIGHLHARVIDVILHLYAPPALAQHADERVAQNGIAQMADVCGLVGIDVGMFDNDLMRRIGGRPFRRKQEGPAVSTALEAHIDVAVSCDFKGRYTRNLA